MALSPGHQKWPDHKVVEKPLQQRVQVQINGEMIADSQAVIEVDEDEHPARFYIPRSDVRMDKLQKSETSTTCPFKGKASYYSFGDTADAAWSYEDPYEEHSSLKDRIAFYEENSNIKVMH